MIKIENVSFSYQSEARGSLTNINLTIGDGECVLLCGRSGCGKTTVTRLINGLIPNFYPGELRGKVEVEGLDIPNSPMYQISAKVGSVFQNPRTQFFNVDTNSEIAFGIENAALPQEELQRRVTDTSRKMKINHLLKRDIFALSGGEKQKIAFASIYAMNPAVFLLDEPSSNLDMRSIEDLRTHLQIIKQEDKTIVIAEHRLYYLMDLVDRIIYLSDGRIEGIFTPQEFIGLTDIARRAMGLRTMNLAAVNPSSYAQTAPEKVLKLRDVALQYQKRTIVQNINLEAAAGEIIAVVGHNGAGKTTFSRALCGLHKEQTGQYLWQNTPLNKKDRTKYSYMVMQDVNYQLFADSVTSECTLGLKNADPALVEQTLAILGLLPFRECHPNTLSGGQKQRVAVAVSMICAKRILVFDEPTSGLDYNSMSDVAGLIKKLAANEKIVFIVTHDYEFICQTCTRVLHIDEGELLEDYAVSEDNEQRIRKLFALRKE